MSDAIKPVGMPKWGLAMTEGKVNAWMVAEGAPVEAGDDLLEIETSKITNVFEIPASPASCAAASPARARRCRSAPCWRGRRRRRAGRRDRRLRYRAAQAARPRPPRAAAAGAGHARGRAGRCACWTWARRSRRRGAPLLLIHGFGGDLPELAVQPVRPAADTAGVAIDLPGHGGSSKSVPRGDAAALAARCAEAMDALALPRAHVAGHSLGGAIALQLALDDAGARRLGDAGVLRPGSARRSTWTTSTASSPPTAGAR